MPTTKSAPECRTAPSPSTASTSSSCSSATPLDESLASGGSRSFPLVGGPLSPPLRHHASFPSSLTPRSSAPTPTASNPEAQGSSSCSSRRCGGLATRSLGLRRPKLPRCLRFRRKRPVAAPRPSTRLHEDDGSRGSSASVGGGGGGKHRSFGAALLHEPRPDLDLDLDLFREEAEYSDYLVARLTGKHAEVHGVVFYEVELHLSRMRWTVMRRFSEFRALRQQLRKHFARRLRASASKASPDCGCAICEDILQSIDSTAFPSRRQDPPASLAHLLSVVRRTWTPTSPSPVAETPASMPSSRCDSLLGLRHPLSSTSTASEPATDASSWPTLSARHIIAVETRKAMLQGFVGACLLSVRSLRQHFTVLPEACASACEIGGALHMIEEFFGLSFTRYLHFLSERGVDVEPKGGGGL